jgi:thiol-disulfide isomerase/thioredoxin
MKTLLLTVSLLLSSSPQETRPFLPLSFEQACLQAGATKRLVFVDFYTTWCEPCKRLDQQTWPDPSVQRWLADNTLAIKVDGEQQVELAKRFSIHAYPSLLFANPDGSLQGLLVGFRDSEQFVIQAQAVLDGIRNAERLRAKLALDPRNPNLKLALGQQFLRVQRLPEALEMLLWCFDHGLQDPVHSFGPLRKTTLMDELQKLSRLYPRASAAMLERRDEARDTLMGRLPRAGAARELILLNKNFDKPVQTMHVYDALVAKKSQLDLFAKEADGEQPELFDPLPIVFEGALQPMMRARRFADVVAGFGDPGRWLALQLSGLNRVRETLPVDPMALATLQAPFERKLGLFYQALLGAGGHDPEARVLAEGYVAYDGRVGSWQSLMQNARRAGRKDLQRELRILAIEALPEDQHHKLRQLKD